MKELLIIKSDTGYYRFHGSAFELCEMSKASVYPLSRCNEAAGRLRDLEGAGIRATLMKLTIHEEPYNSSEVD